MDYKDFKRHLGKAGLTVREFSSLIGAPENSTSNYSSRGSVPATYAALAILMGDAADRGINFRDVLAKFGVHGRIAVDQVTDIEEFRKRKEREGK